MHSSVCAECTSMSDDTSVVCMCPSVRVSAIIVSVFAVEESIGKCRGIVTSRWTWCGWVEPLPQLLHARTVTQT